MVLCKVEHKGKVEHDAFVGQIESYYIVEWYPVYPVLRDTILPNWMYPKGFMTEILEADEIRKLYDRQWYREALYLLAMIDYLSRMNGLPTCLNYNDIRGQKLERPHFPAGIVVSSAATGDESIMKKAMENAIPEFLRFILHTA